MKLQPKTLVLLAITLIYLAIAAYFALQSGNREFILYIVVVLLAIGGMAFVHFRVWFPFGILCCLSAWGALHMAGGLVHIPQSWPTGPPDSHVLYALWIIPEYLRWDHLVHAFGFGTCAWIGWHALEHDLRDFRANTVSGQCSDVPPAPTLGRLVRAGLFAEGCGATNELVEFLATELFPETNVGGLRNLGYDLVANTVGIVVVLVVIRLSHRRKHETGKGEGLGIRD